MHKRLLIAVASVAITAVAQTQDFEAIRDKITDQVAHQVEIGALRLADLQQAYVEGDTARIQQLMGFTDAQVADMTARLKELVSAQLKEHPESALVLACPTCNTDKDIASVFAKLEEVLRDRRMPMRQKSPLANQPDGCRWFPYTAALTLCARFGPWGYWACSLVAYCTYCYGPTHNQVCQVNQ